jgi:hypothetical protein
LLLKPLIGKQISQKEADQINQVIDLVNSNVSALLF